MTNVLEHLPLGGQTAPVRTATHFVSYTNGQLGVTDPIELNLAIAKEIPGLEKLDIAKYRLRADQWTTEIKRDMKHVEVEFHKTPHHWKNDLAFFRLGFLCYFVDEKLGIRYREDQKDLKSVLYTDPADLFLHGVMDSRRGTCANMAALHVALGWRMRWPVSLACVGSHFILRYDDGKVTHNIEATKNGQGGFHSHPDDYYLKTHNLPARAVRCGSDLRALKPREMLGTFFGLRARLYENTGRIAEAESDYLLARYLFPLNRQLHYAQTQSSIQFGMKLFEAGERGHPTEIATWLEEVNRLAPWTFQDEKENHHADFAAPVFSYEASGKQ